MNARDLCKATSGIWFPVMVLIPSDGRDSTGTPTSRVQEGIP